MMTHECLYLLNKPYQVLCQFTDAADRETLSDYFPIKDVYCAGRLDRDSEGLLVLTPHGGLQHLISHPRHKLEKTYWVEVEGRVSDTKLKELAVGVTLNDGPTQACQVKRINAPTVWPRHPPIRYRAAIPTEWIEIILAEGRNRQVRRMTATIGHPTLRLIRVAIGPWRLDGLLPGEYRRVSVALEQLPTAWRRYLQLPSDRSRQPRGKANKSRPKPVYSKP